MKETEGIIFDYGGTLDSRGDHWSEVIWRAYVSERAEVTRKAFREAYVHAERALEREQCIGPQDTFLEVMRKKIGLQLDYLDIYTPELHEAIGRRCYDSARECVAESAVTLRRLAEDYPLAIVSNFTATCARCSPTSECHTSSVQSSTAARPAYANPTPKYSAQACARSA